MKIYTNSNFWLNCVSDFPSLLVFSIPSKADQRARLNLCLVQIVSCEYSQIFRTPNDLRSYNIDATDSISSANLPEGAWTENFHRTRGPFLREIPESLPSEKKEATIYRDTTIAPRCENERAHYSATFTKLTTRKIFTRASSQAARRKCKQIFATSFSLHRCERTEETKKKFKIKTSFWRQRRKLRADWRHELMFTHFVNEERSEGEMLEIVQLDAWKDSQSFKRTCWC